MRRQLVILLCMLSSVLGGCAGVDPAAGPDVRQSATPFELYTHCGIHELKTDDGRFFERADGPVTDGSGNPPPGWGNPFQSGQLVVTDDVAVFTDELGHREEFRVRQGATDFLQICAQRHIPFDPRRPAATQTVADNLHTIWQHHHDAKTHARWGITRNKRTGTTTWTSPARLAHHRNPTPRAPHLIDDPPPF